MRATTVVGLGVLAVATVLWIATTWSSEDTETGKPQAIQAQPDRAAAEAFVPPEGVEAPVHALIAPVVETDGLGSTADDPLLESPPLTVTVLHASGQPAFGGRVVLYDTEGAMRAEGVLDETGRWIAAGVEGPVAFFVLGLNPGGTRFDWDAGRGDHQVTLPDGAWLTGRVLINGAPPGQPFPLRLTSNHNERVLLEEFEDRPQAAGLGGEIGSDLRGGFLTDADGRFVISGLEMNSEVSLRWPRFYTLDASTPPPFPVNVPGAGVLLNLRRPHKIRGRVLTNDGQPAPDATLTFEVIYSREAPPPQPGVVMMASKSTLTFSSSPVGTDGRFAIAIGDPAGRQDAPVDTRSEASPIAMDLDFLARDPDGNWVAAELRGVEITADHDLGNLVLQPFEQVTLRVLDEQGLPVVGAKVRPEALSPRAFPPRLDTDADGRAVIDLALATEGHATVIAAGFRAAFVELPSTSPEAPIDVVLMPASSIHLELLAPWSDDTQQEQSWEFHVTLTAQDAVYDDSLITARPGHEQRPGPDKLRTTFDGWTGAEGSSLFGNGAVSYSWWTGPGELQIDNLRADHPLNLGVEITGAPESAGPRAKELTWENEAVWLAEGETRALVADLR